VYEDAEGRQYVHDDGGKVYGQWLPPADEPVVTVATALRRMPFCPSDAKNSD
jgi:hypothetical protein